MAAAAAHRWPRAAARDCGLEGPCEGGSTWTQVHGRARDQDWGALGTGVLQQRRHAAVHTDRPENKH